MERKIIDLAPVGNVPDDSKRTLYLVLTDGSTEIGYYDKSLGKFIDSYGCFCERGAKVIENVRKWGYLD